MMWQRNLLLSLFMGSLLTQAAASEKYALLVGVTNYRHARMNDTQLKFPEADAAAVSSLLKLSGYETKVLTGRSATKQAIETALKDCQSQGDTDGVLVICLLYTSDAADE